LAGSTRGTGATGEEEEEEEEEEAGAGAGAGAMAASGAATEFSATTGFDGAEGAEDIFKK